MKPFFTLCLSILIAAALSGCKRAEKADSAKSAETNVAADHEKDKEGDKDKEAGHEKDLIQIEHNTNGESVLTVPLDVQKRIALVVAPVAAAEHSPEIKAYGAVLDPSALIALQGDLAAADASIAALKVVAQRNRALFESGEGVSRKVMEAAEADLQLAQIKARTLQRQALAEWGEAIASLDVTNRQGLVDKLADGRTQLIRVDLVAGEHIDGQPKSARVSTLDGQQWTPVTPLCHATKADPKTQGIGFILQADNPGAGLRPGAAVTAWLQLSGEPVKGALIPRSAVLRADARAWVYVVGEENKFTRHEVSLDFPLGSGWFTKTSVSPGDKIATEGVQVLLSEEQKSQLKAD